MPMVILMLLLSVFPFDFALLNLDFRDGHNARRQSLELFKRSFFAWEFLCVTHKTNLISLIAKRKRVKILRVGIVNAEEIRLMTNVRGSIFVRYKSANIEKG